mgnify:CR=1 FL=1
MELVSHLATGFGVAITPANLFYAFAGCLMGTLVGVLPGIGPVATIAMLLPATYFLEPVSALIMLAGIFYGAQYGGSTTAILVNLPGESGSVVTVLDGYQMARQGRAGPALAAAGLGSFFAGCVATLVVAGLAIPLSEVAFLFGPAEYFSLMALGLVGAVVLGSGSILKSFGVVVLGLLLGLVGADVNSGVARFTFDVSELYDGISLVAIAMGIFGYGEIISNLGKHESERRFYSAGVKNLMPTREDFRNMAPSILRGTVLGSALGMLPGGGATISSFTSYALEKKLPRRAGELPVGSGNIRGVAGPEAANNAAAQTCFIPLLTMGIPTGAVMALMLGAMMIHDIQPGPMVMTRNPDLFWGLIVSMWIGNAMLVVLNLPLIGLWVRLLTVPYRWLFPAIVILCAIGVYSINNTTFDVWIVGLFGLLGYAFIKLDISPAPMVLGMILGRPMEENLRRALLVADGDWSVLVTRPISGLMLAVALVLLTVVLLPSLRKVRDKALVEE